MLRVKTVPYSDPNHYQKVAAGSPRRLPDAIWANQFDNTANRDAHEQTTGPGDLGADRRPHRRVRRRDRHRRHARRRVALPEAPDESSRRKPLALLADPQGSSLYHWVRDGELKATGAGSITEGIGIGRVTANLEGAPIDDACTSTDVECVRTVYQLLREEGLFLGSTSGVNVAAAVQVAQAARARATRS